MTDTETEREIQLETKEQELRGVYRERAHLVALLSAFYPSTIGHTDPDTPDWPVVTLQLSTGQAAWHIAPEDADLFAHLDSEAPAIAWDGHSTEEKYARIREATTGVAVARYAAMEGHREAEADLNGPQFVGQSPEPVTDPQPPSEAPPAPKRRGRPRKTAQTAPEAPAAPKEG